MLRLSVFSSGSPVKNLNRSIDLSGAGMKGPVASFGYPALTPTRPFVDYHPIPAVTSTGRD